MADVFQQNLKRPRRPRRSWDEGLGGMREAEAREAKEAKSTEQREKGERDRASRGEQGKPERQEKTKTRSSFREKLASFGKALGRGALSAATGGMSEVAIRGAKAVKGFMDRRSATRGTTGARATGGSAVRGGTRDRDGGGRERQTVNRSRRSRMSTPMAAPIAEPVVQTVQEIAPTYIAYQTPEESAYVSPVYQEPIMQPSYIYSYGNRAWDEEDLSGVPSIVIRRRRMAYPRASRSWDDAELEGLGKSLKKLGKKLKKAVKPKNLLKTAAVAAVAYGGYKLATGGKFTGLGKGLANIGKSLVKAAPKIGGAVMQVAPQLASSLIAYKTATAQEPTAQEDYEGELTMPREFIQDPQGLLPQGYAPEAYMPGAYAQRTSQAGSSLPSWAIPAAIGAGVLLLVTARK